MENLENPGKVLSTALVAFVAVVVFSIILAAGLWWGDSASFIADNEFSLDNCFGLIKATDDGSWNTNPTTSGILIWIVAIYLVIFLWRSDQAWAKETRLPMSIVIMLIALDLTTSMTHKLMTTTLAEHASHPVPATCVIILAARGIWKHNGLAHGPKTCLILAVVLVAGDMFFGWMNHYGISLVLGALSFATHLLAFVSLIAWMLIIYTVVVVAAMVLVMMTLLSAVVALVLGIALALSIGALPLVGAVAFFIGLLMAGTFSSYYVLGLFRARTVGYAIRCTADDFRRILPLRWRPPRNTVTVNV